MEHAATHVGPPVVAAPSQRDQVVVLRDVPWEQYDALCRAREHRAGPRMAYLDGALEIMSPAPKHESDKKMLARLLECYAEEEGLSLNALGSTTYSSKAKKAGLEPDECYIIGPEKPVPDLAIEVLHTSGGIDKLEVYRRLKVREVWYWANDRLWIYRFTGRRYVEVEQSEVLPALDLGELARIVRETDMWHQTEAVRAYRRRLRRQKRS